MRIVMALILVALGGTVVVTQNVIPMSSAPEAPRSNVNQASGDILFEDTFEDEARPEWFAKVGNLRTHDGTMTEDGGDGEYYVRTENSPLWRNYAIELQIKELWPSRYNDNSAGIVLRSQEFQSGALIHLTHNDIRWRPYDDDSWGEFSNGDEKITVSLEENAYIRAEALENTFTIYVKHREEGVFAKIGDFTYSGNDQGMPGFYINDASHSSPPRVEYFKVFSR